MPKNVANKVIRGTFGRLWMNDVLLGNVKKFECKCSLNYEKLDINNELCEQNRLVGYSLAGTVTMHKIDSRVIRTYKEGIKTGSLPEIKMVAKVADPDVEGAERVEILDVKFDEVMLSAFENKKVTEESVPFTAGGFNYLDTIEPED
mgnify:CR=1 FL=1